MSAAAAFARAAGCMPGPELTALVDAALATCQRAHPDFGIDPVSFAAHLGATVGRALPDEPRLGDLYLAFAAACSNPFAIAKLEAEVLPAATAAVRAIGVAPDAVDETLQRVRQKLLVGGDDRRPRLLDYRGQGSLRAFTRVVGVREQLMACRKRATEVALSDAVIAAAPDPTDDPSLVYLREHHRAALRDALATGLAALSDRERALLRYSLIDDLRLGEIGAIYGTHKSTISRWLANARTRLWQQTRTALRKTGTIDPDELDSLVFAIRSGLDLSLERLLAPGETE
ncbi:MAG TPA: sigma factor-like helix-turn-helix DNA-binding protein [Kofleriaceae bacterium]|nr:sigma factor-like helix-turn-helix DNA-binding protein [Kofleriaceae bacterium]